MSNAIESYVDELRCAGESPALLKMCAEGAIAHAKMVEAERDDLQERLNRAIDILNARHTGEGALQANEDTRKAALDFIAAELAKR